jgi:tetratricopeptide (TPR) repeat protein
MLRTVWLAWTLFLVVAVTLVASSAYGKDIDAEERTARTACLAGDYAKGVAILSELFVATEDVAFIYNQGRCFEQNHRYEDAISRFEEFLRVGRKVAKTNKAEARKHIAACRAELAKQTAARTQSAAGSAKEEKERAAKKACLNKDPAKGVALLTDLYVDTNDPNYIYNQGRCYEQNDQCQEAIVRFREYLRKTPGRTDRESAEVTKHIADCEALLAKATAGASAAGSGGAVSSRHNEQARGERSASSSAETPPVDSVSVPQHPPASGAGLRTAGAITMGVGGAFIVTGAILNIKHNSMIRDLQDDYRGDGADSAQTYKTLGNIGYGAGAACVAGGAILYWLGLRAGKAVVVPTVAAGHAGLVLVGGL